MHFIDPAGSVCKSYPETSRLPRDSFLEMRRARAAWLAYKVWTWNFFGWIKLRFQPKCRGWRRKRYACRCLRSLDRRRYFELREWPGFKTLVERQLRVWRELHADIERALKREKIRVLQQRRVACQVHKWRLTEFFVSAGCIEKA